MPASQYDLALFGQPFLDHPQHLAMVDIGSCAPEAGNGLVQQAFGIEFKALFTADVLGNGPGDPLDHNATLPVRCNQGIGGQVVIDLFSQAMYLFILQPHNTSHQQDRLPADQAKQLYPHGRHKPHTYPFSMVQTVLKSVFRVDLYYLFQLELQTIMFTRLYIHIPFCRQKCPYCAFFSQEPAGEDLGRYADLLQREMSLAAEKTASRPKLDSIYFGGGTPSLLDPQQIDGLIQQAEKLFGLAASAEVTLEANPGTVDLRKLDGFRQAGITRLSLGTQSFDDRMLKSLGRIHTAQQALDAFAAARQAGFGNIGIDLIHALPGQTVDLWLAELRQAVLLAPEHLSIYGLTIEEGTPFAAQYDSDSPLLPDDDLTVEMFESAGNFLESHGYEHYEIANYARAGFRSSHNSGYWKRDGYLGLGAGAHSLLRDSGYGTRFSNAADLVEYSTALHKGDLPRRDIMPLVRADAMAEYLFLGLRMAEGIQPGDFKQEFGIKLKDVFGQEIALSVEQGLLTDDACSVRLTRRGMLLSNQVFQRFLP